MVFVLFYTGQIIFAQERSVESINTSTTKDVIKPESVKYLQMEKRTAGDYPFPENSKKSGVQKEEKTGSASRQEVFIDVSVRECDIFKSPVVAKYVSPEKLNNIRLKNPGNLNHIDYYFNKSFLFELIPGTVCDQKIINEFIANFDPYKYEPQRKETEKAVIEFSEYGVKVILLPKSEMPVEVQKYIAKREKGGCIGCINGRPMPQKAGSIKNK
ncbi:MAG: hypothetical protein HYY40_09600 [Bacteroidetes bacterium]|nr:hypothetical protein [Bacteroidota bacterium]